MEDPVNLEFQMKDRISANSQQEALCVILHDFRKPF
jgi:hypothetical protein